MQAGKNVQNADGERRWKRRWTGKGADAKEEVGEAAWKGKRCNWRRRPGKGKTWVSEMKRPDGIWEPRLRVVKSQVPGAGMGIVVT